MKITIEIESKTELDKLSAFFEAFKINTVNVIAPEDTMSPITKGNKKIDPTSLFKIWEKHPKSLDDIRKTAWQRNHSAK